MSDKRASRIRHFAVVALAGLALCWSMIAAIQPTRDATELVAVYPPWWSQAQVLAQVTRDGGAINFGRWPFLVLTHAADERTRSRLMSGGAVLVLDGAAFRFCGKGEGLV